MLFIAWDTSRRCKYFMTMELVSHIPSDWRHVQLFRNLSGKIPRNSISLKHYRKWLGNSVCNITIHLVWMVVAQWRNKEGNFRYLILALLKFMSNSYPDHSTKGCNLDSLKKHFLYTPVAKVMLIPVVLHEQLAGHTSPVSSTDNLLICTNSKRLIAGLTWCLICRQPHCKKDTTEVLLTYSTEHVFFVSFSLQPDPSPPVSEQQRHRPSAG